MMGGRYTIQVGAYSSRDRAEAAADRLRGNLAGTSLGTPRIVQVSSKEDLYTVRVDVSIARPGGTRGQEAGDRRDRDPANGEAIFAINRMAGMIALADTDAIHHHRGTEAQKSTAGKALLKERIARVKHDVRKTDRSRRASVSRCMDSGASETTCP